MSCSYLNKIIDWINRNPKKSEAIEIFSLNSILLIFIKNNIKFVHISTDWNENVKKYFFKTNFKLLIKSKKYKPKLPKLNAPFTFSEETNMLSWPKKLVKAMDQIASGAEKKNIKKYL